MHGYLSADIICENNFPRATLDANCKLRGTDNVQGQISVHILKAKNKGYCIYYPLSNFCKKPRTLPSCQLSNANHSVNTP